MFLNKLKEERARKVVADPSKFAPESVEAVALSRVSSKLTDEEKVLEVYKILGGPVGEENERATEDESEGPKRPRRKKASEEE